MPEHQRRKRTLLWSIVGVVIMLAIVVILGTVNDADGDPLLDTPGAAFVQIIATAGLISVPLIPILRRTQKDAATTVEHVANSHRDANGHPIIMRDELDERHQQVMAVLERLEADQRGTRRDVGRLANADQQTRAEISQLRGALDNHVEWSLEQASKIADLEDTIPKPPKESL